MPARGEIRSDKILLKDVFKMWFRVPEYQRPYVWGDEEIDDLLDDLTYAMREKPDSEYFLGSFVLQSKPEAPENGQEFPENDLLDGQQRMATLLILLAVIRDLSEEQDIKEKCQKYIYQKADRIENIPERTRLFFSIREDAQGFLERYIKADAGTNREADMRLLIKDAPDVSVRNMASAVITIRRFFQNHGSVISSELLPFLVNKVLMIYVATEDLEDAFRLFTILNDRGVPLRSSDILKSVNLGALAHEADKMRYAKLWEDAEGELGDDFDRFLNHIRTILVKERPRLSLLREFEDKIYEPKEVDRATGQKKPALLRRGIETFELVEEYLEYYKTLLGGQNYDGVGSFRFDNLIKVMLAGLPATDWIPPLMTYYDKFQYSELMGFLSKLDNKFSGDWIAGRMPIDRIEAMHDIIKVIDTASNVQEVLGSGKLSFNADAFVCSLDGPVYGRRYAKYMVMKLDYLYQNHDQKMHFETLSIEHILPQMPAEDSRWVRDFSMEQREQLTHRLGNLVSITSRKNTAQGRLDYAEKVRRYFDKNIDSCPNSLRVLRKYDQWTPAELQDNHSRVLSDLKTHYETAG